MPPNRLLVWQGIDAWRAEAAGVEVTAGGVRATGTQLGVVPVPYRLEYRLDATASFVTRSFDVEVSGEDWARRIALAHDGEGGWRCHAEQEGTVELSPPGGDPATVFGALDCDLEQSPLTNLMPVRRHALHQRPGSVDLLVAWVSVPALGLEVSRQRYEHLGTKEGRAAVRFTETDSGFTADLELDEDGFVLSYPGLATRVGPTLTRP